MWEGVNVSFSVNACPFWSGWMTIQTTIPSIQGKIRRIIYRISGSKHELFSLGDVHQGGMNEPNQ